MNQQREIIYEYRDRILEGEDMSDSAREQLAEVVERLASQYMEGDFAESWDLAGLYTQLEQMYPVGIELEGVDAQQVDRAALIAELREDIVEAYGDREEELGDDLMRALERFMLLQIIDDRWREHLHDMDYLREGIHLRGFAQIDPLVAYKNEGFDMFSGLMNSIWEEFGRYIFVVDVQVEGADGDARRTTWGGSPNTSSTASFNYAGGTAADQPSALTAAAQAAAATGVVAPGGGVQNAADMALDDVQAVPHVETRVVADEDRIGRNDPCPCGSGKKYKKCHGA
jgi:preprotein translocase subunit SecA